MSFFKIFDNLRGVRIPEDPGRVVDVRPDDYLKCSVLYREDGLCLYELCLPEASAPTETQMCYDIVLLKELNRSSNSALSVFRSGKLDATELQFTILKDKLPLLLQCVPDLCTRDLIQEVVSLCRSNPSWSLAHIAAHMGMLDVLKHASVKSQINHMAAETGQTPLHIAIKAQKLTAVQMLIHLEANVEAVDANHDTMYHCAAITTKDIIKALSGKTAVNPMLINRRNKEGYTPLQLACLMDRADCVKELLKEGADINSASAGHPSKSRGPLNSSSTLELDNSIPPKCLGRGKAEQNANNFQEEDMKHGGTPLHWAKSTPVLESMIEHGCDLNARNFQDNTALHIMVARNRLNCVILLLSYGADVNAIGMDGDTPLHIAVRVAAPAAENWLPMFEQGDVSVLQALIVFGADVNALNNKGETARHLAAASRAMKRDLVLYTVHAVGGSRCSDDVPNCRDGCSSFGCFDGIAPDKPNFFKSAKLFDSLLGELIVKEALESLETVQESDQRRGRQCRALALDGGGIRGLVIIRMMMSLEKVVGRPLVQCFDWIAGTSTGGILALCLASGKTTSQCFKLYFRLKDKIFVGNRPHDSDALEKLLKQELSENLRMSDISYPRIAITAVAAERHPAKLYLFRNYKAPRQIVAESGPGGCVVGDYEPDPDPSELVWNVARATGAAPTYFSPYKQYLDGGLISNNPTLDLLTEITEYNAVQRAIEADSEVANLTVMVSLGTGKPPVLPTSTVDCLQTSTGLLGTARMAYGLQKLFQLVVDQATQTGGRVVERAQAWCHGIRVPYFRLNPETSEEVGLNETDNKVLVKLLWESMVYMRNRRKELAQLARLLKPCNDSPSLLLRSESPGPPID
ncbi:85/88 kDa calcium-independent phospholipase A2-like isoform X3 [Varroa jacobsoni]|uniref:phospholipase A2 n=1 Tax=Varroa destructor TaxID=109461 RepID=A0A7M7JFL3_VARDE|nr:85/88 kDa calcium-independent phospholipase A2-like isoform X3 [Varroa destructor]XP_022697126.1 85/88 kDa calcium-independent phospholipase A2-like isoform X3 [Varroa jacobsoni]